MATYLNLRLPVYVENLFQYEFYSNSWLAFLFMKHSCVIYTRLIEEK
jgi:hypothetical protein